MRLRPLDLSTLQVFVTVCEERSMSTASNRLGISQSAVSQSIRLIEDELGVVLFDRQHRPLRMTPAALTLYHRGRVLLADSAQVRSAVVETSLGIAPEVNVGLVDSFAATCGPFFIRQLLERAQRLAVRSGLTPLQGEKLIARDLDIVVTTDYLEGIEGVVRRRIYSEPMVVLLPKGSRTRRFSAQALQRLAAAMPLIRFNTKSHLGSQVETLLRRLDVRAAPRLEVDTADSVVAMVAAGLGWAVTTPTCLVQGGKHAAGVQLGQLVGVYASRSLYLLGREGEHSKLFEAAYTAAQDSVQHALLPALKELDPKLPSLIECGT